MRIEYLDDLPVIGDQIRQLGIIELLNTHFPDHGHWKGISGGKVVYGWLLYILSEADHRLSHVEDWSDLRLNLLSSLLCEPELRSIDFCDDRLGRLLDRFSDDEAWNKFEISLGKTIVQVYGLQESQDEVQVIRTDSFNAPQHRKPGKLFRHGYSKQRRTDQPFCKVMMSALDPLAVPLAVDIVKGSGPDTDHYLPVIQRIQNMVDQKGNLYVADSQLGSMSNRTAIHLSGDYYLCPLSKKQVSKAKLNSYIDQIPIPIKELPSVFTDTKTTRKPAYYHEFTVSLTDEQTSTSWQERRLLVYSPDYADGLVKSFVNRIEEAKEKIQNLVIYKRGRRNPKTLKDLHARTGAIIKRYKVEDCFEIEFDEKIEQIKVQRHKKRPAEIREKIKLDLTIKLKEEYIAQQKKRLGWQLYGTNVPKSKVEASKLVSVYRDEYRIEHLFDYLINRDTGLLPLYLKKEERIKGLIRLLSLAMKCSILIQHRVRMEIIKKDTDLKGIYPGNKGRKTRRPTTAMLLRAFNGIGVAWISMENKKTVQMTELNKTQMKILDLLGVSNIYGNTLELLKTNLSLRET